MAFETELLSKLTTTLAADIETYNEVIKVEEELSNQVAAKQTEVEEMQAKILEVEARNDQYLKQISNLLANIKVAPNNQSTSTEEQIEQIKNTPW